MNREKQTDFPSEPDTPTPVQTAEPTDVTPAQAAEQTDVLPPVRDAQTSAADAQSPEQVQTPAAPLDALKRHLQRFCDACELDADLNAAIDADAVAAEFAEGRTPEALAAEFVAFQAATAKERLLRPLWGRGERAVRRADAFLWEDPTVCELAAQAPDYAALRALLSAEEAAAHDAARAENAAATPLTKRVWFNVLTFGLPLFCKWFRAKCRPTARQIVESELFTQWLRLERCRRLAEAALAAEPGA